MKSHYKIVHTTCGTGWDVMEKRIFNESVWMNKNGHQVVITAPENTPLFQKAKKYGFRVYAMSFTPMALINNYRELIRIFQNEQPHVLNAHGHTDAKVALAAAQKAHVPCRILSCHDTARVRNSWYNRRMYKKMSHYIFTTTDYAARHLQALFHLKSTQVFSIPNSIPAHETLVPPETARKDLAQALGCDPATRFIGSVGQMSRNNGVTTIFQAFRQMQSRISHHLVLVNGGPDNHRPRYMEMAQKMGISSRTHFIGLTENTWPGYRGMDCVVLAPEDINGMPDKGVSRALLEAMYCSCPVIGSKTAGISEIIQHGITGLLFDAKDAAFLSELVLDTLNREAATLERVHAARELVRRFYTIDAMGRNIIRIYRLHQVKCSRQQGFGQDFQPHE
ncbi:MAG: glycosyltransferase family 4 protein [Desulfotignum sp.]|jgi:glycosyltransferase involved in cell wall biosynthesis|nr:glycosyltransferase family 4 protein [Desulfotignum sp.]